MAFNSKRLIMIHISPCIWMSIRLCWLCVEIERCGWVTQAIDVCKWFWIHLLNKFSFFLVCCREMVVAFQILHKFHINTSKETTLWSVCAYEFFEKMICESTATTIITPTSNLVTTILLSRMWFEGFSCAGCCCWWWFVMCLLLWYASNCFLCSLDCC